ncbi:MAG: GreA/GreB family elongation factor [Patescibacteria group bacterium]
MQVPIRKSGKYTHLQPDPYITREKFNQLESELAKLKNLQSPATEEVKRLAAMGDFSENAAYIMAKGRLRAINQKILELAEQIKKAKVIQPVIDTAKVRLGSRVTIFLSGQEITYLILGSAEANPSQGIVSHNSPIGAALLGRQVGDNVIYELADGKKMDCQVIKIE